MWEAQGGREGGSESCDWIRGWGGVGRQEPEASVVGSVQMLLKRGLQADCPCTVFAVLSKYFLFLTVFKITFSLACFVARIEYIMHTKYALITCSFYG